MIWKIEDTIIQRPIIDIFSHQNLFESLSALTGWEQILVNALILLRWVNHYQSKYQSVSQKVIHTLNVQQTPALQGFSVKNQQIQHIFFTPKWAL